MKRALVLALLCLAGCAQIIGLEDRKLDPDGGVGTNDAGGTVIDPDSGIVTTSGCVEYCTLAQQLCTPEANVQLYETYEGCLAVCGKYPTDPSTTGNTLACRLNLLRGLSRVPSEAATTCQGAGPGGGPPPGEPNGASCGTDCGGFCKLRETTCPRQEGDVDCERKCQALVNDQLYNAKANFGSGADTLSCRVAHLSAAALYDATETPDDAGVKVIRNAHCDHSGIRSKSQCDYPMNQAPDCNAYCKIVSVACTGDKVVYESNEQCLAFCKDLADGTSDKITEPGTKRCYRSGAYDALEGQANGCQRAGITGDGCLNGRTGSYCLFAKKKCPTQFAQAFPTNTEDECRQKSAALRFASVNDAFSVASSDSANSDNMQCRMRRLLKVFGGENADANCAAALGLPGNQFCN